MRLNHAISMADAPGAVVASLAGRVNPDSLNHSMDCSSDTACASANCTPKHTACNSHRLRVGMAAWPCGQNALKKSNGSGRWVNGRIIGLEKHSGAHLVVLEGVGCPKAIHLEQHLWATLDSPVEMNALRKRIATPPGRQRESFSPMTTIADVRIRRRLGGLKPSEARS